MALTLALALLSAHAQSQQFPADASTAGTADRARYFGDKGFTVTLADRGIWRLDYKSYGHFFVNTRKGCGSSSQWRAED
jgi:hypothetical protein